jgi:hypothetical protein
MFVKWDGEKIVAGPQPQQIKSDWIPYIVHGEPGTDAHYVYSSGAIYAINYHRDIAYVDVNGELQAKVEIPFTVTSVPPQNDGSVGVTLTGLPAGTNVTCLGQTVTETLSEFILLVDLGGTYELQLEHSNYLDTVEEVTI